MSDDGAWFAAKRFGYGAGLPIRWQGWVTLGVFLVVIVLADLALNKSHRFVFAVVMVVDVAVLVRVAASRTRGGWRWRAGGEE